MTITTHTAIQTRPSANGFVVKVNGTSVRLFNQLHKLICIFFILLSGSIFASPVIADNIRLPVKLDYPLLRELMLKQLFKTADKRVEILNDPGACNRIYLSDPKLRADQKKLVITAHVEAKLATAVFGNCTQLLDWEGEPGS